MSIIKKTVWNCPARGNRALPCFPHLYRAGLVQPSDGISFNPELNRTAYRALRAEQLELCHILLYPAFVLVDDANERYQSAEDIPDTTFFMWMDVGRAYFEPLLGYDIYSAIAPYERDVLILHGDADSIVPLEYSQRALETYISAELHVLPGAGQGFYGDDASAATTLMLDYLDSHKV